MSSCENLPLQHSKLWTNLKKKILWGGGKFWLFLRRCQTKVYNKKMKKTSVLCQASRIWIWACKDFNLKGSTSPCRKTLFSFGTVCRKKRTYMCTVLKCILQAYCKPSLQIGPVYCALQDWLVCVSSHEIWEVYFGWIFSDIPNISMDVYRTIFLC